MTRRLFGAVVNPTVNVGMGYVCMYWVSSNDWIQSIYLDTYKSHLLLSEDD